jgi:prepilin-type N-terminal cleavage/methylation domain-containing protein
MKSHSKTINVCDIILNNNDELHTVRYTLFAKKAFSLIEVVAALVILAIASSTILVVLNRCVASAANSALKMRAFEVARENMEKLLASDLVKETADFGTSDKYPEINWQTVVETFYEPITSRMWVRAVCSAGYGDASGQTQTVELTHWLTNVTKKQLLEILKGQENEQQVLADELIDSIEQAAEYAGVDVETVQRWVENGMIRDENGSFFKSNLDIYIETDGNPTEQEKELQLKSISELLEPIDKEDSNNQDVSEKHDQKNTLESMTGLSYEELEQMDINEILQFLKNQNPGQF